MNEPGQPGAAVPSLRVSSWWGCLLIGRRPLVTLIRLLVLVVISLVAFRLVLIPIQVTGHSMEPTYRNGRINFLNQLAYRRRAPQRGDVVGIRFDESRLVLLKRVVGLPGERLAVRQGRVIVDGEPLAEAYARGQDLSSGRRETTLGPDEYFVIGDNREESAFGVVRRREIKGKVLF